jgi:hypothetical protein
MDTGIGGGCGELRPPSFTGHVVDAIYAMLELCLQAGTLAELVLDPIESLNQIAGGGDGLQIGAVAHRHPRVLGAGNCLGDRRDDCVHGALQVRLRLQRSGQLAENLRQIRMRNSLRF